MNKTIKPTSYDTSASKQARGLGWFSIGLGTAELLAPGPMARLIGVDDDKFHRTTLRAFGLREIAVGIGLLAQPTSPTFAWLRVAGDAMDLAALGASLITGAERPGRVLGSIATVAGVTAADIQTALALGQGAAARHSEGHEATHAITIRRSPDELYALWRNFENLPRFMTHLDKVETTGAKTSHWEVKTIGGRIVAWDAEITDDLPGKRIAWRSVPGSGFESSGEVEFRTAPRGRGTEVVVTIRYAPPAGKLGVALASIVGEEPGQLSDHALRQLKQIMETGEIMRSDASIHRGFHPAQPSAKSESMTPARRVRARNVTAASSGPASTTDLEPEVAPGSDGSLSPGGAR
jgi:uncharacterized membrane protein